MTEETLAEAPYRILVSVGSDGLSDPAIAEAIDLARHHAGSELHVVHVVQEQMPAQSGLGIRLLDERLQSAPKEVEARLTNVARQVAYAGRAIGHVRVGEPAAQVLQVATDIEADVIVVGTHQRKALERFFLGSVAEKVVRDAHCPVMVVTTKNYDGLRRSRKADAPCPACVTVRTQTAGATYWCERHARPHLQTHVFGSTDRTSLTPSPTGMRIV